MFVDKISPFPDLLKQTALRRPDAVGLGLRSCIDRFYARWEQIGFPIDIRTEKLSKHDQFVRIFNYGTPRDFSSHRCELFELVSEGNPTISCPAGVRFHYFVGFECDNHDSSERRRINIHTTTWLHPFARKYGIMSAYTSQHLPRNYFENLANEVLHTVYKVDKVSHVGTRSDENSITRLLTKLPDVSGIQLEKTIRKAQVWNHVFLRNLLLMGYEINYERPIEREDVVARMGSNTEVVSLSKDYPVFDQTI